MSSKIIDIGVRQGILWIGGEAYPLRNIARVQAVDLVPARKRAVVSFVKQVVLWTVLAVGGIAGSRFVELPVSEAELTRYIGIGAIALAGVSTLVLLVRLARRTYYALVIETSGHPHTTLVSPDEAMVNALVRQIVTAIHDPRVEFHQRIEHHHHGDNYFGGQHATITGGSHNVGIRN